MQELPFGERSAKHILFHIFKQIVNYKKQDSSKGEVRTCFDPMSTIAIFFVRMHQRMAQMTITLYLSIMLLTSSHLSFISFSFLICDVNWTALNCLSVCLSVLLTQNHLSTCGWSLPSNSCNNTGNGWLSRRGIQYGRGTYCGTTIIVWDWDSNQWSHCHHPILALFSLEFSVTHVSYCNLSLPLDPYSYNYFLHPTLSLSLLLSLSLYLALSLLLLLSLMLVLSLLLLLSLSLSLSLSNSPSLFFSLAYISHTLFLFCLCLSLSLFLSISPFLGLWLWRLRELTDESLRGR